MQNRFFSNYLLIFVICYLWIAGEDDDSTTKIDANLPKLDCQISNVIIDEDEDDY